MSSISFANDIGYLDNSTYELLQNQNVQSYFNMTDNNILTSAKFVGGYSAIYEISIDSSSIDQIYFKGTQDQNFKMNFYNSSKSLIRTYSTNQLVDGAYMNITAMNDVSYIDLRAEALASDMLVYEFDFRVVGGDYDSPSEITGLDLTPNPTTIDFTWNNPVDTDFDHVNIYRDDVKVGESTNGTYQDTALSLDTTYSYKVTTVDTSGNESVGITSDVTTLAEPDTTPPNEITSLDIVPSDIYIDFTWNNAVDTDFDHVNIYRDDVKVGESTNGTYQDTALSLDTTYSYKFTTVDTSSNESVGITSDVTTLVVPDTTPPSIPTIFTVEFQDYKNVLSWTNPVDTDFDHVNIYRDDVKVAESIGSTYQDLGIEGITTYNYKLSSVDTTGNESSFTTVQSVITGEIVITLEGTFDYITDNFSIFFDKLKDSATVIIGSILVLMALIVGAFFLLGLGKKAVKKAK